MKQSMCVKGSRKYCDMKPQLSYGRLGNVPFFVSASVMAQEWYHKCSSATINDSRLVKSKVSLTLFLSLSLSLSLFVSACVRACVRACVSLCVTREHHQE
jgi:hypothetical protein